MREFHTEKGKFLRASPLKNKCMYWDMRTFYRYSLHF